VTGSHGEVPPPLESALPRAKPADYESLLYWGMVWIVLAVTTGFSAERLQLSWFAAWHGIRPLLAVTGWATLKVWVFWGLSGTTLAGLLLRIDPEIDLADAILAGLAGVWAAAYLLGNLFGPIGLFRAPLILALLGAGLIVLWRSPPKIRRRSLRTGEKLALLAWGLLAVSMLPMALSSPVPPYMDVLSYPSSVQRILNFHRYLPFNNDPYGCWGPYTQTPALELFYAMLALGGHVSLAVLTESAAMVPMAGLMIFGTYRLGKALFDDTSGGMAALLLFFTCLFRRAQGMRGTAVALALVGLGLAFFLELYRSRSLGAVGAVLLGTSVASHTLDGSFAMALAGAATLMWLVERGGRIFLMGVSYLVGATLVALPEFFIGSVIPLPYPVLPLIQLAGLGVIGLTGSAVRRTCEWDHRSVRWLNLVFLIALSGVVAWSHFHGSDGVLTNVLQDSPALVWTFAGGLIVALWLWWRSRDAIPYGGLMAFALLIGIGAEWLANWIGVHHLSVEQRAQTSEIGFKLREYLYPYFVALGGGLLFGWAYRRISAPLSFLVMMVLLIYPWHRVTSPLYSDSYQHSIPELWAFNLDTAAHGYWVGAEDARWVLGPDSMALVSLLDGEIQAGRITPATHVLHLTSDILYWRLVQFPAFTGINDDPYESRHDPDDWWEAGGRVRGWDALPAALAQRPPYILMQVPPPAWMWRKLGDYEPIFHRGSLMLFRRRDLGAARAPSVGS
jgi:hypothetical protein